jgi:ERO1-like protein beta
MCICADARGQYQNLQCFVTRVASYPERLQYIYFNTVLLLRAVARIGPYLSAYDYCALGTHEEDAETLEKVAKVVSIATNVGKFDETALFRGDNANVSGQLVSAEDVCADRVV